MLKRNKIMQALKRYYYKQSQDDSQSYNVYDRQTPHKFNCTGHNCVECMVTEYQAKQFCQKHDA
jgi:hypothetical protein